MTAITSILHAQFPATRIGLVKRLLAVAGLIVRTLADFNRYIDSAQRIHGRH